MSTDPVEHLDDEKVAGWAPADRELAGYRGPGHYFWDESWAYLHGPFPTADDARGALRSYCIDYLGHPEDAFRSGNAGNLG